MLDFGLSLGEQVCKSMHTALLVVLANHAQPVSYLSITNRHPYYDC